MARDLEQDEINGLLRMRPDPQQYPDEQYKPDCRFLHEHHLFTLLNGNPQSIILVGSLLADHRRGMTLRQVYKKLTEESIHKVLGDDGIEETMLISLRSASEIAFNQIKDNDPEAEDLIYLLGLLPGGVD